MTLLPSLPVTPALSPKGIPPVALPNEVCMCCWYVLYADRPYPLSWSSILCTEHKAWYTAQRLARLTQRASRQEEST